MKTITVTRTIPAPIEKVFDILADHGECHFHASEKAASRLKGNQIRPRAFIEVASPSDTPTTTLKGGPPRPPFSCGHSIAPGTGLA